MPADAPACLPALSASSPRHMQVPAGSWCTHAHVLDGDRWPFVASRSYTPPPASVEAYVAMLDRAGLDYGVVVQASVYGNDNRPIADALSRHPARLRGIVSIDGSEREDDLIALRNIGVCGIRVNEHFAGGTGADHLERLARRCATLGWHIDLGLPGSRLRELMPRLVDLDVDLVLDHMGFCGVTDSSEGADFAAVLALARRERVWTKLSGAYRLSCERPPYRDVAPFTRALFEAAPTRSLWGSDWPNVAIYDPDRLPDTGTQLEALHDHLGDEADLVRVLADNPRRLYGVPGTPVSKPARAR